MTALFDQRQVQRAFSRASQGYNAAAALQHEVEARLLEALEYRDDPARSPAPPNVVLDLGCGPGNAAAAMRKRWPKTRVIAADLALPMLRQARRHDAGWHPLRRDLGLLCADARALPLAEASVDVVFCNLCLQWVDDLATTFAEIRRVLRPGGLLLVSTFATDTLHELHEAFSQADATPHVSPFIDIAGFGDALVHAGFRDPVLDRDVFKLPYPDMAALMRALRAIGATNALTTRRRSLTGRTRFAAAAQAYESRRDDDGQLPSTWEVVYAQAWAPPAGAPIRHGDGDIASMPVSQIPIRRRSAP